MAEQSAELVRTINLGKVYPDGTRALKGVDFEVHKKEIHGLLGENGAGKTTLTKIISGILKQTSGEIMIKGEKTQLRRPRDALGLGIGMVHQHLALVPRFTAFENILLGTRVNPRGRAADTKRQEITRLAAEVGLGVQLDEPVENLSLGAQQRVEILKMLYRRVDLLILDEPTSSLTPGETEELFKALKNLKETGHGIVFITHKLREVLDLCDRITVLRQGEVTGRAEAVSADAKMLARMMVGRDVILALTKSPFAPGKEVLSVQDLWVRGNSGREAVRGVALTVRLGEVLGIAGVEGNGQTELALAISGVLPISKGKISMDGKDLSRSTPYERRKKGAALIPEDRKVMGLVGEMSLAENVILGRQREGEFRGYLFTIAWEKVKKFASGLMERFEIVAQGTDAPVRSLSGGNQQKVIISREVSHDPLFILASQPTRGLDVAATEYMRKLLLTLRDAGKGIMLFSADLDEIFQLSDTIAVMYEGRIIDILPVESASREKIGLLMGGVKE